jgi:SAM-dependent methyltransferase
MGDAAARGAQLDAWRAVAGGWERRRALVWDATREVSERLVALLDPAPGDDLLEVAAGPGDTGLLAAAHVAPDGRLLSTDGVPQMVDAARRRAAELGLDNVDFAVADAAELGLPAASFDGALCRFGVMLVPDCDAAVRELARVLRPGGRAAVAVWAESERNPWLTVTGRAALRLGLAERPDPEAPGPFRLAAPGRLRSLLEGAGLEVHVEEEVSVTWRAGSLDEWWDVALDTSRSLAVLVTQLSSADVARVRAGAEERLAPFVDDEGAVAVPGVARVVLAVRPANVRGADD